MIKKSELKKLNENEISTVAGGVILGHLDKIGSELGELTYCVMDDANKQVKGWFSSEEDAWTFAFIKNFSTETFFGEQLNEIMKEEENK